MPITPYDAQAEWKRQQKDTYIVKRIEWSLDNYIIFNYGDIFKGEKSIKYKFYKTPTDKQVQMIKKDYEKEGWIITISNSKSFIYLTPSNKSLEAPKKDRFNLIDVD